MVIGVDTLPPDDQPRPEPDGEDPFEPVDLGVASPGAARRGLRLIITLLLVAAIVSVFGLNLNGNRAPNPSVPPVGATFQAPGADSRLAVVESDGALTSMRADGSSVARYLVPGVTFRFPAWSPNGATIAAIGRSDAGPAVYRLGAQNNGSAPAMSTIVYQSPDHPPFYVYWAPDSEALAFLTTEPDGIALRYAAADASDPATTVRRGAPMYWQWLDPKRLFVHSGGDSADAFAGQVGIDGAPDAATTVEAGVFRVPAMSADRTFVAYATSVREGSASVVVRSVDGTTHHEVPVFSMAAFTFDPAGDSLAFIAATKPGSAFDIPVGPLRAIDPTSGVVRTLLDGSVVSFFWAPDGRTIAALRVGAPDDTKVTSADVPQAALARAGAPAIQAVAGVELRIDFVDVASGAIHSERIGRLSDLFINQVLPFFDQYALSHRFWSPDSASIVLPIVDDQGASQIEVIPADASDARLLAAGLIATWSP